MPADKIFWTLCPVASLRITLLSWDMGIIDGDNVD